MVRMYVASVDLTSLAACAPERGAKLRLKEISGKQQLLAWSIGEGCSDACRVGQEKLKDPPNGVRFSWLVEKLIMVLLIIPIHLRRHRATELVPHSSSTASPALSAKRRIHFPRRLGGSSTAPPVRQLTIERGACHAQCVG